MVRTRMSGGNRGRAVIGRWVIVAGALLAVMAAGYAVSVHRAKAAATGDDELADSSITREEVNWTIYWETYDQPGDNTLIDAHPAVPANGGKRIFPDKKTYDDAHANERRLVFAVVQFPGEAPPAGTKMWFRLWDVDDPSDDDGPIDADASGPDNRDGTWAIAGGDGIKMVLVEVGKIKRFPGDSGPTTCDAKHCKVAVRVGMQPGDNWRFCATMEENEQALRQMTQDQADHGPPPPQVKRSEMLTTWRKLYLELDSMDTGLDHGVSSDIDATYANTPHAGESGAEIDGWNPGDDGRYEGGTATTSSGGGPDVTFEIIDHWDDVGDDTLYVVGDITPYNGEYISFCDDDQFDSPRTVDWSLVKEKFAPAYIEPEEDVEARSLNTPFVPTVRTATVPIYNAAQPGKIRSPSSSYWVALVLSAHQGKQWQEQPTDHIRSSVDGDPDLYYHFHGGVWTKIGDPALVFGTACCSVGARVPNVALVFLEAVREHGAWVAAGWVPPQMMFTAQQVERRTVAHELGHVFGLGEGPAGTLMESSGFDPAHFFNEEQLKAIRESVEIEEQGQF